MTLILKRYTSKLAPEASKIQDCLFHVFLHVGNGPCEIDFQNYITSYVRHFFTDMKNCASIQNGLKCVENMKSVILNLRRLLALAAVFDIFSLNGLTNGGTILKLIMIIPRISSNPCNMKHQIEYSPLSQK